MAYHTRKSSEIVQGLQDTQRRGLCEKGYIPQYIMGCSNLSPDQFPKPLPRYLQGINGFGAYILEYIPGAKQINSWLYCKGRWEHDLEMLKAIHEAGCAALLWRQEILSMYLELDERVLWMDIPSKLDLQQQQACVKREMEQFGRIRDHLVYSF